MIESNQGRSVALPQVIQKVKAGFFQIIHQSAGHTSAHIEDKDHAGGNLLKACGFNSLTHSIVQHFEIGGLEIFYRLAFIGHQHINTHLFSLD